MLNENPTFKMIETEVIRVVIQQCLSRRNLEGLRHDVSSYIDHVADGIVMELVAYLAGKTEKETVSYPQDWWQALRQRWFPRWWLKRHPVKLRTVTLTETRICPHLPIPEKGGRQLHHMQWLMQEPPPPSPTTHVVTVKISDRELMEWLDKRDCYFDGMPSFVFDKYPYDPEMIPVQLVAEKVAPKKLLRVVQRQRNHWEGMIYIECEVM